MSDDKILGLWSEGKAQAPSRPVVGGKKVVAFARAVERAAYERAAQECDQAELTGLPSEWDAGYNTACRELGGRIRKLKTKEGA